MLPPLTSSIAFSGVDVSVDVRYSPIMRRQFMNILFKPTAAFKSNTSGLCGFMDGDITNDLVGPDGKIYTNADEFALSCMSYLLKHYLSSSSKVI